MANETYIHDIMGLDVLPNISNTIGTFLCLQPVPRFPPFYLQCKSHKSLDFINGRWKSRPIAGMVCWATSSASSILSILGSMMLCPDRSMNPMFNALDFVGCLEQFHTTHQQSGQSFVCTSIWWFLGTRD